MHLTAIRKCFKLLMALQKQGTVIQYSPRTIFPHGYFYLHEVDTYDLMIYVLILNIILFICIDNFISMKTSISAVRVKA